MARCTSHDHLARCAAVMLTREWRCLVPQFGAIRQIRLGNAPDTRGTAFVVYEDIYDAKTAVDHLSGFNVCGRYLVVLYYQQTKMQKRLDTEREMKELAEMRARLGLDSGVPENSSLAHHCHV